MEEGRRRDGGREGVREGTYFCNASMEDWSVGHSVRVTVTLNMTVSVI